MSAEIWKGAPVSAALNERMKAGCAALAEHGIVPTLAILRVGERADDLAYERGAMKRCETVGVAVRSVVLPAEVDSERFFSVLEGLNTDPAVHGILLFRPLPEHLDSEAARRAIAPEKDVDGCTDASLAGVFTNTPRGFAPCTAQAVLEILDYYGVDCKGKTAVVIGRSLVVGRPAAMLLLHRDATVTLCHTKTENMAETVRQADIVVTAAGRGESIGGEYFRSGQIVIDVGISWNEEKQKLCGDVKFEEAASVVSAITPVPGGVGTVTTGVLVSHVIEAAERYVKTMFDK